MPGSLLVLADVAAWRAWLDAHEDDSDGVQLVLAKKGVREPTSLTYAEALEEALCSGWIDGRRNSLDDTTFQQRFTPRRARSLWSIRNVGAVEALVDAGRMRPRGLAEIALARADGRLDRAYAGPAAAEPPADLLEALAGDPAAAAAFAGLNRSARYSRIHPVVTAPNPSVRTAGIARIVAALGAAPD